MDDSRGIEEVVYVTAFLDVRPPFICALPPETHKYKRRCVALQTHRKTSQEHEDMYDKVCAEGKTGSLKRPNTIANFW